MKNEITEKKGLRKDFGEITSLAESIKKVGLINKITISKDGVIVAGRRRLRAWQSLHKKYPDQFEVDPPTETLSFTYEEMLNQPNFNMFNMIQLHENTQRKEFTPEEISEIKSIIEHDRDSGKLPDAEGRDSRDIIGELTGISGSQVDRIDIIVQAAKKSSRGKKILADLNSKHISVNTAWQMVTKESRNLPKIEPPKGEFDVLYSDIPIAFDSDGGRGAAENHYPTEPKEYFLNVEIPSAKNAVIFFWIPNAFLIDGTAAQILDNWGFYPKTIFTWKKPKIGLGSWSRNQTEHLIMGIKGNMPTPAKLFSTLWELPMTKHSKKPIQVYERIEAMYPKRTYIELWGRGKANKGWEIHGNEVDYVSPSITKGNAVYVDSGCNIIPTESDAKLLTKQVMKKESPIEKLKRSKKK